jgi:hypothetical protein
VPERPSPPKGGLGPRSILELPMRHVASHKRGAGAGGILSQLSIGRAQTHAHGPGHGVSAGS